MPILHNRQLFNVDNEWDLASGVLPQYVDLGKLETTKCINHAFKLMSIHYSPED